VAPTSAHPNIINQVRKEKCYDLGFKLLLSEKGITMKLYEVCDEEKGTITFNLKEVSGIRIEDL